MLTGTPEELFDAAHEMAHVFGDGMTADMVGSSFTCSEADAIARFLYLAGFQDAAVSWLLGHASGEDWDDTHALPYDEEKDADRTSPRTFNEADIRAHLAEIV